MLDILSIFGDLQEYQVDFGGEEPNMRMVVCGVRGPVSVFGCIGFT